MLAALFALATWKTYPLGGVILDLPSAPRTIANEMGTHVWQAEGDAGDEFAILTVSQMPTFDLPVVTLASFLQGAADGYHGRLVAQKDLLLNGWPGIEGRVESEAIPTVRFRAYRVKDQMISIVSTLDDPSTDRIFGSLTTATRFGKGTQRQAGPAWRRASLGKISVVLPDEASVEAERLTGAYGNRTYILSLSKDEPSKANAAALRENGAKAYRRDLAILADAASEQVEATALDGKMTLLVESVVLDGKTVTLSALVPTALKNSPEVKRFFASLKLG